MSNSASEPEIKVKGSVVISMSDYIKQKFGPTKYDNWVDNIPPQSKEYFVEADILPNAWYPMEYAVIQPTLTMCNMFFKGDKMGAWHGGRFGANEALHGIYKVFVKIGSPMWLAGRIPGIFNTFYKPGKATIEKGDNRVLIRVTDFPEKHGIIELRVAGWFERALEICGVKRSKIEIVKSVSRGDDLIEAEVEWAFKE